MTTLLYAVLHGAACMLLLVLTACAANQPEGRRVSRAEFGGSWPLKVDEGTVRCEGGNAAVFEHDGRKYALNGVALSRDVPDIQAIQRRNEEFARTHPDLPPIWMDVGPLRDIALKLCP